MEKFYERIIGHARFLGKQTTYYAELTADTAADIPNPADHPEWEIGSELLVLENGGSRYRLSNARQWVKVNFNTGGGGITEEEKAEIVRTVIESLGGNPVFGYVDENNNIIVQGNLADGDYFVKYEMEDGSTLDIGELVLLNTSVQYSVTNHLTNCSSSNTETSAAEGTSYSAVIIADAPTVSVTAGYKITSITVTMGGADITDSAVNGGNINIESVTGDIVITAAAEKVELENILATVGYKTGTRIRSSNGEEQTSTTYADVEATNFIPIEYGDTITIQNIKITNGGNNSVAVYDSNKAYVAGAYMANFMSGVNPGGSNINGEIASQTLDSTKWINSDSPISASSGIAYIRFSADEITENSIVTVQKN